MKRILLIVALIAPIILFGALKKDSIQKLDGPITVSYLKKKLSKNSPRLILTPKIEKQLIEKVKTDSVVKNVYKAIKLNAKDIQEQSLLKYELKGNQLLNVSREMLYRMNILSIIYAVDKDAIILKRIDDELNEVCNFIDWNPQHFLDVAEMSMAVSLALDLTGGDLPESTIELAKNALIHKAIEPGFENTWWAKVGHNWNQVCHAGLSAAAVTIAEEEPELAVKVINRALDCMPHALIKYAPDGAYPEGPVYWSYGTSFSVLAANIFETVFGTDFGIAEFPGFMKSAEFYMLTEAPSGMTFNYSDCKSEKSSKGNFELTWFAMKTGNAAFFQRERFLYVPEEMGKLPRNAGVGLIWLSQFAEASNKKLPIAWKGDGINPIVIFNSDIPDTNKFYFGGKGGTAKINHGHMDAGSFIFELDGIRWSVDPGKQGYGELEKAGFELWQLCQNCDRWKLLILNNLGHSTLTVNDELFIAEGYAPLVEFRNEGMLQATFDLTALYGENLNKALRTFTKENSRSLLIKDQIELNDSTKTITWQLITQANVELADTDVILKQEGKQVKIENLSHPDMNMSVISLDPPPFKLDKKVKGLKRLEYRYPAYLFPEGIGEILIRISGE